MTNDSWEMPDFDENGIFVFPPTAEEIRAIEDHILFLTESKTKRTKRFKEFQETYRDEWVAYHRAGRSPIGYRDKAGWRPALQNVMNRVSVKLGYARKVEDRGDECLTENVTAPIGGPNINVSSVGDLSKMLTYFESDGEFMDIPVRLQGIFADGTIIAIKVIDKTDGKPFSWAFTKRADPTAGLMRVLQRLYNDAI